MGQISSVSGAVALAVIVFYFVTSMDSAAMVMDMFASGEENKTPTYYKVGWVIAIGVVTAALLFINDTGIQALQEVVIIIALPFFILYFFIMFALLKAMNDDSAARRRVRTRQWEKTDSAEKLEEAENRPAPGYDAEGNELARPELEYDPEEGGWRLSDSLIIEGDLAIGGDSRVRDRIVVEGLDDVLVALDEALVFAELPGREEGKREVGEQRDQNSRDRPTGGEKSLPHRHLV